MTSTVKRRQIFAVLVALVICIAAWVPALQDVATQVVDASLKGSLLTFAALRALGGFISVAQHTELSAGPLVAQATLAIGQILNPVSDLLEQASAVMLLASLSLGVQKALLLLCGNWIVSLIITITAIAWATARILGHSPAWLDRIMFLMFLVRFLFPVMAVGSHAMFDTFMAGDLRSAQQEVNSAADEVKKTGSPSEFFKLVTNVEQIKAKAEKVADALIRVTVGFLIQTVILPLLVLAALLYAFRGVLESVSTYRKMA